MSDKKLMYMIYPGLKSYCIIDTSTVPGADKPQEKEPKIETTALGKETVDGHPCVKNKITITSDDGKSQDIIAWQASDLNDFPIKTEMEAGTATISTHFTNIQMTAPDASLFDPPSDFKKYDSIQELMMHPRAPCAVVARRHVRHLRRAGTKTGLAARQGAVGEERGAIEVFFIGLRSRYIFVRRYRRPRRELANVLILISVFPQSAVMSKSSQRTWGGRFWRSRANVVKAFTESVSFDWRLWPPMYRRAHRACERTGEGWPAHEYGGST